MGRFATTIFSATQLCNVGTMLQLFETKLKRCVALKSLLQIVPCNITLSDRDHFLGLTILSFLIILFIIIINLL